MEGWLRGSRKVTLKKKGMGGRENKDAGDVIKNEKRSA